MISSWFCRRGDNWIYFPESVSIESYLYMVHGAMLLLQARTRTKYWNGEGGGNFLNYLYAHHTPLLLPPTP
jgi:hypothetical protein